MRPTIESRHPQRSILQWAGSPRRFRRQAGHGAARPPVACWWLALATVVLGAVVSPHTAAARAPEKLFVALHKSLLLDVRAPVETVSIADTDLADFVVAASSQVLIHGKKIGTTSLVVWERGGTYHHYDLVIQRGFAYKQIMLNVRVAEVNKSVLKEYGLDYATQIFEGDEAGAAGLFPGGIGKPAIPLSAGSLPEYSDDASIALRYLKGADRYETLIRALAQKGVLRILARPNLLCIDGEEASFLAGGEFPVPVAQTSSTGGTSISIEWREFGVRLNFVPTVIDSTLINLKVEPEVSSLDFNNAVVVGGFVVPALQTRRATTRVELHDGENLIIGGLRSTNERDVERKIPVLGDIPLLGYLFRSRAKETEETDLIILVSPTITTPMADHELPKLPGEQSSEAPTPKRAPRAKTPPTTSTPKATR